MYQHAYRSQEYRQQDVMGASPIRLVVMAYDLAIKACEQQDFARATKAISVLRDALNFDYPEVAVGLFRLYQWSLDCIRQGDYAAALSTLRELRDAWANTEKHYMPEVALPNMQSYHAAA
ncbi:MAG: flagellar protein FliS [Chloroflexi bacterium]|jgi:flagellin-specific chaperone FliS|nr:flagellar export chaperone FliS [Anaerolineaceae bacterium]NMB90648.1 flagellar protein FliS [Chloroflexota bacterium]